MASQVFTNIHKLDQSGVLKFSKFAIRNGTNLMIFGPAGTGKTEMCIQSAESLGYQFTYLNLSVLEAPDLVGLPMIDEATETSKYALPASFPRPPAKRTKDHKGKVLVVDEIDKAKPELQNPMLELFQFRSINGVPLDFDAVLATGNRPDEGAFSMPVSKALTGRCKVYQLDPKFEPWQQWASEVGLNGLVVGFLSRNNEYFYKPDRSGDATAYCSCSPRTWSMAASDLDSAQDDGVDDYQFLQSLVAGYVGVEAAIKFQVWLEHYKEIYPMIDALVHKGKHPELGGRTTMDRILVTAIAAGQEISRLCESDSPSKKEIAAAKRVVENVSGWLKTMAPDIQIASVKSTLSINKITAYKMTEITDFMEIFRQIRRAIKSS